jgi:hypothetical protein
MMFDRKTPFYKKSSIFLSIIILLSLSSCDGDSNLLGKHVNQYADAGRTGSYEDYPKFQIATHFIDYPVSADSAGVSDAPIAVSAKEYFFPTADGKIKYVVGHDEKRSYSLNKGQRVAAGLVADSAQNIYAVSSAGKLYSFGKQNDKPRFILNLFEKSGGFIIYSDPIVVSGGLIVAHSEGEIAKVSFDGKIIWEKNFDKYINKTFAADNDGNIILPLTNDLYGKTDQLTLLNSDGTERWIKDFPNTRFSGSPAVRDGKIYILGTRKYENYTFSTLYTIDLKGKILKKREFESHIRFISLARDGRIYLAGYNAGIAKPFGSVHMIQSDGEFGLVRFFDMSIPAPIMISGNSFAFTGIGNEGIALFVMSDQGHIMKVVQLDDVPEIRLKPFMIPGGVIAYAGLDGFYIVKIDETAVGKILF